MNAPARLRALVVDDVPVNRLFVRAVLESVGATVDEATNALEAVAALREPFDVVVLDFDLGHGDTGLDVLRHVQSRAELESLPVILMSGVAVDNASVVNGLLSGAVDYLLKPVSPDVLVARVTVACRARARLHAMEARAATAIREAAIPKEELEDASVVQQASLPVVPLVVGGVRLSGAVVPSSHVSGDLFDVVSDAQGRVSALLLDVAGHGVGAALVATSAREVLRRELEAGATFDALTTQLDARLDALGDPLLRAVSVVIARFDRRARTVEVLNAGMPPLLFGEADRDPTVIESLSGPLGLYAGATYRTTVVPMPERGWVLMASDGATLGRHDPSGVHEIAARFDLARWAHVIANANSAVATSMVREVIGHPFSAPPDDATLLFGAWGDEGAFA
jgi:CheY-like chemotaxis protein